MKTIEEAKQGPRRILAASDEELRALKKSPDELREAARDLFWALDHLDIVRDLVRAAKPYTELRQALARVGYGTDSKEAKVILREFRSLARIHGLRRRQKSAVLYVVESVVQGNL